MASLEGNVKIPVVGTVPKKAAAGGGLVVGVLIVVYYYRKKSSASSAAAAAASTTDQYPPDGTSGNPQDPYSTDPATGQTYGNEATGSGGTFGAFGTGSAMSSTYPWDGTTGNEADPFSLDPATGVTFGAEGLATGGANANPNGGPPFANNSDWEVWVTNQLEETDPNINADNLAQALGLYLNGQPVSPAQKTLVFDATGVGGDPPVAGAQNYPPNVRTNGSTGGAEAVTVPNVVGQPQEAAYAIISEAGLKPSGSPTITGKTLTVDSQSPPAGSHVQKGSTVTLKSTWHGTTQVRVPNVTGMEQVNAVNMLKVAGLHPSYSPPPRGKTFYVDRTAPAAGAEVAKGSTVRLFSEQKQYLKK